MVDLHSHILPNVDDGAKNVEETIKMAEIAVKEGITKMVATPHHIPGAFTTSTGDLCHGIEEVNRIFKEREIPLEILPGNEAYMSLDLPEKLQKGEVLPINNSAYVLVELPMADIPNYTEDILYEMRLQGYKPIIAHPERYRKIIEEPNLLKRWIDQGNYTQINSMSITGGLGKRVQQTAKILLQQDMIHCIGTDTHSSGGRAPKIKTAEAIIKKWIGEEKTAALFTNNEKVIEDQEICIFPPKTYREKNNIFIMLYRWIFHRYRKAYGSRT